MFRIYFLDLCDQLHNFLSTGCQKTLIIHACKRYIWCYIHIAPAHDTTLSPCAVRYSDRYRVIIVHSVFISSLVSLLRQDFALISFKLRVFL